MSVAAAVMPAPRAPVEVREFEEPSLEPGETRLRRIYSAVCGTDVRIFHRRLAGDAMCLLNALVRFH
jgi:D-arabinose 1-dehydrogenase-like Zn-dependent alcohol dehydrogenase